MILLSFIGILLSGCGKPELSEKSPGMVSNKSRQSPPQNRNKSQGNEAKAPRKMNGPKAHLPPSTRKAGCFGFSLSDKSLICAVKDSSIQLGGSFSVRILGKNEKKFELASWKGQSKPPEGVDKGKMDRVQRMLDGSTFEQLDRSKKKSLVVVLGSAESQSLSGWTFMVSLSEPQPGSEEPAQPVDGSDAEETEAVEPVETEEVDSDDGFRSYELKISAKCGSNEEVEIESIETNAQSVDFKFYDFPQDKLTAIELHQSWGLEGDQLSDVSVAMFDGRNCRFVSGF